jgi:hypothetical protein
MKLWNRRPVPGEPVQPEPLPVLDFHDAEIAFLKRHQTGLTTTGSLVIASGGSFHPAREGELQAFLRQYLIDTKASRLWSQGLVDDFRSWLTAGAEPVPSGAFIKGN